MRLDGYGRTLDSQAYAINDNGVVVGSDAKGGFVYAAGRITRPVATAGTATLSGLSALNNHRDFAGALTVDNRVHAALLRGGRLIDLGTLDPAGGSGDGGSRAAALSESDQVVGTSVTATTRTATASSGPRGPGSSTSASSTSTVRATSRGRRTSTTTA